MDAKDWMKELEAEKKAHEDFRTRAEKVVARYEDEQDRKDDDSKYNILWSNIEVLHAALYAKSPVPDIRRRHLDKDPNGKKAAEIAERAVAYCIDSYDFDGSADMCIDDYLLPGLGVMRLRYQPYYETTKGPPVYLDQRETGLDENMYPSYGFFQGEEEVQDYKTDEEGYVYVDGEDYDEVVDEEVSIEPVNWRRFRWQPAARWDDVDWCAIEHYMTKDELEESYGDHADHIPLGFTSKGEKAVTDDEKARALIYEIFDKKARQNIEIADGYDEILKTEDDPLNLEHYYPFPKPLMSTLKNGKLIPIPDYVFYQDQAIELDRITNRINRLTEQLKYRGYYDASFESLANIETADDGDFIGVPDFAALTNNGTSQADINKILATMPLDQIQSALSSLYVAREQIKQTIYEITGIADIMRGSSNANETLGAQQLKTQFGSMRMSKRQRKVAYFMKEIIKLKVEIMVENFGVDTLGRMTGMEVTPEVHNILTSDMMRSYRIDIETDSTIAQDAEAEKQSRIEMVTAITNFVEKAGPMVQTGLLPVNVAKELLSFAVRGFKVGRTLEDTLDEMGGDDQDPQMMEMQQKVKQFQQQLQQQAEQYVKGKEMEFGKQIDAMEKKVFEAQKKAAINQAASEHRIVESRIKGDIAVETNQHKNQMQAQLEVFKAQLDAILKIPEEKSNELQEMSSAISAAFHHQQQENQAVFDALQGQIAETQQGLTAAVEFMKKPAKVIRDKTGKVVGASRE